MGRGSVRLGLAAVAVGLAGFGLTGCRRAQQVSAKTATEASSSAETPRMPDGKPDLNGMWMHRPPPGLARSAVSEEKREAGIAYASRRCAPNEKGCRENTNQNVDQEFSNRVNPNRPLYRPQYWDKVQQLDYDTNTTDPMLKCQPLGVPRMGPPTKIVQTANEVILLYALNQMNEVRVVPTDGRPHDPDRAQDISYYGDAVGHWESDTLVVDSVGFNDITWLDVVKGASGYFHSEKMHVVERFRREGKTLHYQATVEDPEVLLEPWAMTPWTLTLNPNPKVTLHEGDLCRDYETGTAVSKIRH
jgi:hypothetical protein